MKRLILLALTLALALMPAIPGAALAAGNTTQVEQKWLDFQKALTDQMVKDGKLTRQDADRWMKDLQTNFASPGDSIYKLFSDKIRPDPGKGGCKDGKCARNSPVDDAGFRVYSMMTGKTVDALQAQCTDAGATIWGLAKQEGKLDALKKKIYDAQAAGLDALVKGGVMADEQRQNILKHLQGELDGK
jgi:hypothetical protein